MRIVIDAGLPSEQGGRPLRSVHFAAVVVGGYATDGDPAATTFAQVYENDDIPPAMVAAAAEYLLHRAARVSPDGYERALETIVAGAQRIRSTKVDGDPEQ